MASKACSVCHRVFLIAEFPVNKTLGSRLGKCKDCLAAYHTEYREKNRERLRLNALRDRKEKGAWINACRRARNSMPERQEIIREQNQVKYARHVARLAIDLDYFQEFRKRSKATSRRHYRNHRSEILAKLEEERRIDPETFRWRTRESVARWYRRHPETARAIQAARRAKIRAGHDVGFVDEDVYAALFNEQNGKCAYCECDIEDYFELEHMIPLSRDGLHDPENVVLTCGFCNNSKHNKLLWSEWIPPKFRQEKGGRSPQFLSLVELETTH